MEFRLQTWSTLSWDSYLTTLKSSAQFDNWKPPKQCNLLAGLSPGQVLSAQAIQSLVGPKRPDPGRISSGVLNNFCIAYKYESVHKISG